MCCKVLLYSQVPLKIICNISMQKQELAEIAANEYYITHGSHLDRSLLVSLLPSYLPDKALEGAGALEAWADLVEEAFRQITVSIPGKEQHFG